MNKMLHYFWIDLKMMFRVPLSLFFTTLFPQLLMIVLVSTNNNPIIYENIHQVDVLIPSLCLFSLFSSGIIGFSNVIGINKEKKLLEMYKLKGLNPSHILSMQLLTNMILSFISMILVIITSKLFYNAIIPSFNLLIKFFLVWILAAIIMFAIGFIIGIFSKNGKVSQTISTPVSFVLMTISGVLANITTFPSNVLRIVRYNPTTQVYYYLFNNWAAKPLHSLETSWYVLFIWIIIFAIIILYGIKKKRI